MQQSGNTYHIADHSYYVEHITEEDYDNRPTIVFLHDALGSVKSWKDFPINLCRSLKLNGLLYDRLGHGFSEPYQGVWKKGYMEKEAFDVLPAVLAKFNVQDPILLGISDGGSIALLYATQYDQVTALISIAGHIKVEQETRLGVQQTIQEPINSKLISGLEKYHSDGASELLYRWQSTWTSASFADWDITKYLGQIKAPSLILQGEADGYATFQHCYDIAAGIGTNAKAKILPNCAHFPTQDQPIVIIELVREFLNPLL